ncbi:glycoside hydrolase family 5 [Beutenbergia cavernae DSM 12333]|uniref:Glycoside hydrolase family 5 n=1 Tax=Beutenbergia cavernae (strain ATCC BAA-8 / DSM 12333 / CCUG 43141 / JCM 11478 / NBRC 16432 / NCIMB 13614 / HKI 0122) TaxID=471853 RepID=C5C5E6_BEUC1|nr:cellulase family glycosylhydrolase [Beutenbergia cavernae]ACQ82286.1 glycoside hydrolase family 5 [Beutenbergia cavernae DSM 12333]
MTGFVRRSGTRIVDGAGRPALRRGVGIGTWLLPEGYMWRFRPAARDAPYPGVPAQSPREIEALVVDLVGADRAAEFWSGFRQAFFSEADVARIAQLGFDHVRLPINSRVLMADDGRFLEEGFALVDACVAWCEAAGLHVVLDLHGAPGGQTGTNIDDSPRGRPELFEDPRYRELTIRLWTQIARRYASSTTVASYDLLNEPIPNEFAAAYADRLVALYRDLTAAIRAVDPDHLIQYEGAHWASDPAIFTEVWDENSAVHFHRYWSPPDTAGIAPFLEVRSRLGLPLYMGEGGENSPEWLAAAFGLYEAHDIGWNFWTWKKVDNAHSPAVVVPPPGWADVLAYAAGEAPRPAPSDAWETLSALVEAMRLESCEWHGEIVAALLRRAGDDGELRLPAYGFGYGGAGASYATAAASPDPRLRADDGVTLRLVGGAGAGHGAAGADGVNPFAADPAERARAGVVAAELAAGDWLAFDVDVTGTASGRRSEEWGGSGSDVLPDPPHSVALTVEVVAHADDGAARPALDVRCGASPVAGDWVADAPRTWRGAVTAPTGATTVRVGPLDGALTLAGLRLR